LPVGAQFERKLTVGRGLLVGVLLVCNVRCYCAEEFKHEIVFVGVLFSDKLITVVKRLYEHLFIRK